MRPFRYKRLLNAFLSGIDRLLPVSKLISDPLRVDVSILDYCNIRCPHCGRESDQVKKNRNILSSDDLKNLHDLYKSALYVTVTGWGEPLMNKDLFEILKPIQDVGSTVSLISNGTLLDQNAIEKLVGNQPLLLNISIDAATPEIFEKVRLGARFEEVIGNMNRLVEWKEKTGSVFPVINVNMTLMRDTIGEIPEVLELARRWKAGVLRLQTIMFFPDSKNRSQEVSNREAQEAVQRIMPLAQEYGVQVYYVPVGNDYDSLLKDESENRDLKAVYGGHRHSKTTGRSGRYYCPLLWHHFDVDVLGNMGYCCMSEFDGVKPGNCITEDPRFLRNHPKMIALRRLLVQGNPPKECQKCWALEPFGWRKIFGTWMNDLKLAWQMRR